MSAADLKDTLLQPRQERSERKDAEKEEPIGEPRLVVSDLLPRRSREKVQEVEEQNREVSNSVIDEAQYLLDTLPLFDQISFGPNSQETVSVKSITADLEGLLRNLESIVRGIEQRKGVSESLRGVFYTTDMEATFWKELSEKETQFASGDLQSIVRRKISGFSKAEQRAFEKYAQQITSELLRRMRSLPQRILREQAALDSNAMSLFWRKVESVRENCAAKKTIRKTDLEDLSQEWQHIVQEMEKRKQLVSQMEAWFQQKNDVFQKLYEKLGGFGDFSRDVASSLQTIEIEQKQLQVSIDSTQKELESLATDIAQSAFSRINPSLRLIRKNMERGSSMLGKSDYIANPYVTEQLENLLMRMSLPIHQIIANSEELNENPVVVDGVGVLSDINMFVRSSKEKNRAFAEGSETLWHSARMDTVEAILRSGYLASRIAQQELFGSFRFSTATTKSFRFVESTSKGIVIERNGKVETITKEEFDEIKKYSQGKSLDQETHQVCFSENIPASGYGDGVSFVFSRRHVLSGRQFMEADGLHVFDGSYVTESPSSPGFALDIQQEPMVLVVKNEVKTSFMQMLERLRQEEKWQESMKDLDIWVENNVVFVDDLTEKTITESSFQEKLKAKDTSVDSGTFYMTGEQGQTADLRKYDLYGYASKDKLREKKSKEKESYESKQIIDTAQQEKIVPVQFIALFRDDPEIDDLMIQLAVPLERYSLAKSTLMTLRQYEKYFASDMFPALRSFWRVFLVLHDIGKPIALAEKK